MTYIKSSSFYTKYPKKSSTPAPPAVAVGWHPGIYIFPSYNNSGPAINDVIPSGQWTSIKGELAGFNAFRGVQLRIHWAAMETSLGVYDFTLLKDYLDEIAQVSSGATRKYGFAMIHIRHASSTKPEGTPVGTEYLYAMDMVPAYMRPQSASNPGGDPGGATYGGGQFYFNGDNPKTPGKGGKMICWWNGNVRIRAAAFAAALGAFFDQYMALQSGNASSYKVLEGITISESSFGDPRPIGDQPAGVSFPSGQSFPEGTTKYRIEAEYHEGYYLFMRALLDAFPHTITGGFANFSRQDIKPMINGGRFYPNGTIYTGMKDIKGALGTPNTLPDHDGFKATVTDGAGNPGLYYYYYQHLGLLPLTTSWQPPDYMCTALGGSVETGTAVCPSGSVPQTINGLYTFTRDNLKASHLFATRTTNLTYWADFKSYLTSQGIKPDRTGGLPSTPPTCYPNVDLT